ncbi:restriction endonuclease [Fluviispira sanaruensis]|uniref:Restriction endonuclease n=1 Tax=Fluviispira sanaruensis TaxID=2493639 RepID=A0A4V0P2X3_FLUSA|nr:restriction endonuclease [Fluviispira sanaruensis]BBH54727.1 restriction endonuclease [Fluviispira sanaruensis]
MYFFIFLIIFGFVIIYYINYKKTNRSKETIESDNKETNDISTIERESEVITSKPSLSPQIETKVNKVKQDFNPYKHASVISKAEAELQRFRKMYFDDRKKASFIMFELKKLNGLVFEEMVLTCLKEAGFRIWRSPSHTGDGGIDGMVFINETKILLQSKCWSRYIDNQDVLDFSNAVIKRKAQFGYFVHTGKTGKMSYKNIGKNTHFISGAKLLHLILQPSTSEFEGKSFLIPELKMLLNTAPVTL